MSNKPEQDEEIAVCTECKSDQNVQKLIRNPFFQQGGRIPCQYCSGLVIITKRELRDQSLKQTDRQRGL
jgi:DNA-directed RNA polymerase subunit RPC12/RpoP